MFYYLRLNILVKLYQMKKLGFCKTLLCTLFLFCGAIGFSQTTPTTWIKRGVGGGGELFAPSISPFNSNEIWVSSSKATVHKSLNFGETWITKSSNDLIGDRFSRVQFSSDENIMYVVRRDANEEHSPAISTDAGETWSDLPKPTAEKIHRIHVNQNRTGEYIMNSDQKVYLTKDDGQNYEIIYQAPGTSGAHLAGVYYQGVDTMFVCLDEGILFYGGQPGSVAQWEDHTSIPGIPTNEKIVSFKGAIQGNEKIFLATTIDFEAISNNTSGEDISEFKNIYKLKWGDNMWTSITSNLPSPSTDKIYHVEFHPQDTNVVYLSGTTTMGNDMATIFRSTDGGHSFQNIFMTPNTLINNENIESGWQGASNDPEWMNKWNLMNQPFGFAIDPNDASRLVFTDGKTIHKSVNGGATWTQAYTHKDHQLELGTTINFDRTFETNGLSVANVSWLTWLDDESMIASYQDLTAIRSADHGSEWSFDITGLKSDQVDDINVIKKHHGTNRMFAAGGEEPGEKLDYTDARLNLRKGRVSRSSDDGATWETVYDFEKPVLSIAFDKTDEDVMYVAVSDVLGGIGGIYKCDDVTVSGMLTFNLLSGIPPRTEGRAVQVQTLSDGAIVAIYGARDTATVGPPSNYFTNSSGVFYSEDGGNTWEDRTDLGAMSWATSNLEVDPNDETENTWFAFVGMEGPGLPGVYRTTDRGLNWVRIYDKPSYSCTFHPTRANEMYICTKRNGLLYVTNTDSDTPDIEPQVDFKYHRPKRIFFNPNDPDEVWVTTNGNEMFMGMTDLSANVTTVHSKEGVVEIYPNPNKGSFRIDLPETEEEYVLQIQDCFGRTVYSNTQTEVGVIQIDLPQDIASGMYTLILATSKEEVQTKLLIQE